MQSDRKEKGDILLCRECPLEFGDGGIEPPGKSNSANFTADSCENRVTPNAARALHSESTDRQFVSSLDADLQVVVKAWELFVCFRPNALFDRYS